LLLLLALLIAALFCFQFAPTFRIKRRTVIGRIHRIRDRTHGRPVFGIGGRPESVIAAQITL
jgi:hypothetical protein